MKIALAYTHYPVSAGKFLKKAFKKFEPETVGIGPCTKGYIPWNPNQDYFEYIDYPDNEQWPEDYVPDLLVQVDAHLTVFGDFPFKNVCYAIDNHVRPYNERDYDGFYGAHSLGAKGTKPEKFKWLPCAYDPEEHFNKYEDRPVNGLMIGVGYDQRLKLIKTLGEKYPSVIGATGYLGREYNDAYNQAKIAIVKSANQDVAMRLFENMAQGCCVLADNVPDLEKLGLLHLNQIVIYNNDKEAVELFGQLLADDTLRTNIAKRGEEWVRNHTWADRAEVILNDFNS